MVFRQNTGMSKLRRLISLCLMLAFASYGMVVAAPAHAHSAHDNSAILHVIPEDAARGQAGHDHHHDHEQADDDHSTNDNGAGGDATHGGFHVHAVAAFTAVDEPAAVSRPLTLTRMTWAELSSVSASGLFAPLKKPPRIFL